MGARVTGTDSGVTSRNSFKFGVGHRGGPAAKELPRSNTSGDRARGQNCHKREIAKEPKLKTKLTAKDAENFAELDELWDVGS